MPYRMPAEWERQEAMWLAWPHNKNDWPDRFGPIPWVYVEIIRYLSQHQRIRLLVRNDWDENTARDILERAHVNIDQIDFWQIPTNRIWMRDSGPIFVRDENGQKVMLNWKFNAWAKYPNHKLDDKVPERAQAFLPYKRETPWIEWEGKQRRIVLEGGAIDVNGQGALITTEECLIDPAVQCRNPGFTFRHYEEAFAQWLGIDQVIWLGKGIAGDDTHGHVDDLARFINEDTIVTVVESNEEDENHAPLKQNLKRLKAARALNIKPYNIIELPMPRPVIFEDTRLPLSYANFLIANNIVLVPTFNDPNDRTALSILSEAMPEREIIGIHASDLVWGFGTLHCMSQQEPADL